MLSRGYELELAESIYKRIEGFGSYGFPESHAASFALLAYYSAWIKCHHPAAFCCALLNSQPMGFYSPSQLTQDARRNGVTVLPVNINESALDCLLVTGSGAHEANAELKSATPQEMRLGFRMVKGLSDGTIRNIVAEREKGRCLDVRDLVQRTRLDSKSVTALTDADAFRSLSGNRLRSRWVAAATRMPDLPLAPSATEAIPASLTPFTLGQEIIADFRSTVLTLRAHPL